MKSFFEMNETNVCVEFCIYGNQFEPQEITDALSIVPTRAHYKGEAIKGRTYLKRKETCWAISTEYQKSLDISTQLQIILLQLKGKEEILKSIRETFDVKFKIYIVINIENNESPAIYLTKETLHILSEIEIDACDFDMYIYS